MNFEVAVNLQMFSVNRSFLRRIYNACLNVNLRHSKSGSQIQI
jgi:hypothetical protein